jgi:hypothetical protein
MSFLSLLALYYYYYIFGSRLALTNNDKMQWNNKCSVWQTSCVMEVIQFLQQNRVLHNTATDLNNDRYDNY